MSASSQSKSEKRLARKEVQKGRKAARKQAEQTTSFSHVLNVFVSPEHVRKTYRVFKPYAALPSDAVAPEALTQELSRIISRPLKYHAKYAAQEIALLRLAFPFLIKGEIGVVDIGSGNANLACLLNLVFGAKVLCVDRDPPPPELSGETRLPPNQVTRVTADIGALDLRLVSDWTLANHLNRGVLVLAKHLCGLGTDLAIDFVERLKAQIKVVGVIAATCCCNKILGDDAQKYSDFYSSFPVNFFPPADSVGPVSSNSIASCSHVLPCDGKDEELFSKERVEMMARCSGYRNNAQSQYARATSEMVQLAEAFEDALQAPRHCKLAQLFEHCEEKKYVPSSFSLQNRVLVASDSIDCECKCSKDSDTQEGNCNCVIDQLSIIMQKRIQEEGSNWPLDFRPQGFGSSKFDYDGT